MLMRNNSAADLHHQVTGVSFSTLTNLLHRIVLQPSADEKEMPSGVTQKTKQAEGETSLDKKG